MKKRQTFFAKTLVSAAAIVAVAGIVPNWNIVFGYGSSSNSTPTCGDTAPANAPVLLSAVSLGNNSVQLNWKEAINPVSYYLVTFGTKPGEQLYGNPNVGPKGTTTYTVGSLPAGQRFYFKVRAGNGCATGAFSNEVSAVSRGAGLAFAGAPTGFQAGVLGASTEATPTPTSIASPTPTAFSFPTEAPRLGFFARLINFFRHLFGN